EVLASAHVSQKSAAFAGRAADREIVAPVAIEIGHRDARTDWHLPDRKERLAAPFRVRPLGGGDLQVERTADVFEHGWRSCAAVNRIVHARWFPDDVPLVRRQV